MGLKNQDPFTIHQKLTTNKAFNPVELTLTLPHGPQRVAMTGEAECNLKLIREAFGIRIAARNSSLKLSGDSPAVGQAARVLDQLAAAAKHHQPTDRQRLLEMITRAGRYAKNHPHHQKETDAALDLTEGLPVYLKDRRIEPASAAQRDYLQAILSHDMTFCCGPAGTGKTYLAVAAATAMLKRGQVRKLVLVRPAVEAGERLGFLPGTMQDKVNPYLRPLLDALHDMMEYEHIQRFMDHDIIEIVPLAFMRGRTLNEAMIILDEAQNTTRSQMMMFLTRLGHGSKMIITGDTSQTDLDDPCQSGLVDAIRRLKHTSGIAFSTLDRADIVRHNLVQKIVLAYDRPDHLDGAPGNFR